MEFIIFLFFIGVALADLNVGEKNSEKTSNLLENLLGVNEDLERWEPPSYLKKHFPYYVTGFDEDSRPIIVLPFGKWDWTRAIVEGGVTVQDLNRWADQIIYRIRKWASAAGDNAPGEVVAILDFEDFSLRNIASKGATEHAFSVFKKLGAINEKIAYGFFVNTNFLAESVVNLSRPFMGSVLDKFELYGTRKENWIPKLVKKLPADQLPPDFGGNKNHEPVYAFP